MARGITQRATRAFTVSIGAGASVSSEFVMPRYALGNVVSLSDNWTTANLGVQVKDADGVWHTLRDNSNGFSADASISAITALCAYLMPRYWFCGQTVRLFSHNGSGVAVNQVAAHNFEIQLKS
jgi:hypothetical protein